MGAGSGFGDREGTTSRHPCSEENAVPHTLTDPTAPSLKERAERAVPVKLTHRLSADAPAIAGRVTNSVQALSGPTARDFTIDFLRAISILAVAIGHWLVVVPSYVDGHFDGVNALATVPLMQWLSWAFQVMPLFFIVGGFANAVSWRGAAAKGTTYAEWLRTRLVRLVKPTAALLAVWTGLGVALRLSGVDPAFVQRVGWLVVVPLWFLAVYVVVVALAPAMLRFYERAGLLSLVMLGTLALIVDQLRFAGSFRGVEYTNFLWVFLFCQQLGFFWLDGRLRRNRWHPVALFVGGLGSLLLLTHAGPYPLSMVGVPGERIANNAPPTIALIALGVAQAGLGLLLRPVLARLLERRPVAGAVIGLNRNAMTILLWHFTALVVTALAVLPGGMVPTFEPGTGAFWLVRIASVLAYAVPLAGLVVVFGPIERRGAPGPSGSMTTASRWVRVRLTIVMVAATVLLAAAFMVITVRGLNDGVAFAGFPVLAALLFLAGSALLGRSRREEQ
jgi:fucose 4-O-acetylase-like acetyltransferase